ncbi:DUF2259 domain-containing protein [Aurantimonas sp. A2-1-M11]|uniref:DUF2259 domain-containing protein n=1 Tax=Aurantimonas sp. A2-1-M11 TaxID=3113712 RepID=UPI002F95E5D3
MPTHFGSPHRLRSLMLAALLAAAPATARAGDFATLQSYGFSADGSVYAFGQSGIQDGSGFPYAEIFFLDVNEDRFLAPSPVRVRLDDDSATLDMAMDEARSRAASLFDTHDPQPDAGQLVFASPAAELPDDPHRARFLPRAMAPSSDRLVELRIETIPLSGPAHCTGFGETVGYRLVRIATKPGTAAQLVHEDSSIPESRGCPLDYRVSEVRVLQRPDGGFAAVAIIGVEQVGFEGPDLRFIANPVPVD